MKKVVLASLLACAAVASSLPSAYAQQPVSLGTQAAGAPAPCPPMPDAEYKPYTDAMGQKTPQTMAPAIEAYLAAFPQSCYKLPTLVALMQAYSQFDPAKTLDTADKVLQLDPNNYRALLIEAAFRRNSGDALTDATAKQAALDAAAAAAEKGLTAPKPTDVTDDQFKTLQGVATPIFYGAIADAALNKKDTATAIDNFKKELASVPLAQTQAPGAVLQDTYMLGLAYLQSTPPDLLDCAFYVARFVDYAPEPYKTQIAPTAKYCYKKFHGVDDGYDAVAAAAKANLNPTPDFAGSVKPAPTPAEQIHTIITTTTDLSTLATSDKELVFQFGSPEDAAKVWDTIKGKNLQFPDVVVEDSSTPNVLKVAVTDDAKQSKTPDFTFNMTPLEEPTEPKATATVAQKAAYKKAVAEQAAIKAAIAPGSTVTLTGTFDSYTPNPIMIVMKDGAVVLKAAAKPAPKPAAARPHPAAAH
jgi:hypothetical protein